MSRPVERVKGQRRADDLAAGYTGTYALINRLGVITGAILALLFAAKVLSAAPEGAALTLVGLAFMGVLAADLLTGLIHWGCDTWGEVEVPLIGPTLIRTFREHHVDPQSITRHDWAEINGEACLGGTLVFAILLATIEPSAERFAGAWWTTCFITAAMFTNQVHKWAHMPDPPRLARWLQRAHLILTPRDHIHHHTHPFIHSYCITTGWMNPLLNRVRFWRLLERGIARCTGALPRRDDLGEEAAQALQASLSSPSEAPGA